MKIAPVCPNCGAPVDVHPDTSCVLNALINVLRDREELDESELQALHAECWVDDLWDDLAPIIDRLGAGEYSHGEGEDE